MPDSTGAKSFNEWIVEEFRAHGGIVGEPFTDTPLLLRPTTGAKSGKPRVIPLAYVADDDRMIAIASKAGASTNPDWYCNLVAHPEVTVEVGIETFPAHATVVARNPGFGEYQKKTTRIIPVVTLEPIRA